MINEYNEYEEPNYEENPAEGSMFTESQKKLFKEIFNNDIEHQQQMIKFFANQFLNEEEIEVMDYRLLILLFMCYISIMNGKNMSPLAVVGMIIEVNKISKFIEACKNEVIKQDTFLETFYNMDKINDILKKNKEK